MNNSECSGGMLHDYEIKMYYPKGILEVCSRCKDKVFFPFDVPNHIYLSYHLRSSLQQWMPRYYKEYKKNG